MKEYKVETCRSCGRRGVLVRMRDHAKCTPSRTPVPPELPARIQRLGLKMWWVAEQSGVSRHTLQRWVTGKSKFAYTDTYQSVDALLKREEAMEKLEGENNERR